MRTIAIVGGSGFIGRSLISALLLSGRYKVRVLTRSLSLDVDNQENKFLEVVDGGLDDLDSLARFLEPNFIVINLVYLWGAGKEKNLLVINNLLNACLKAKVSRLVHCSTAAVYGRVSDESITEKNNCHPISEYGVVKLQTEKLIVSAAGNNFQTVILRPTSIYGVGGEPLKKIISNLAHGNKLINYFRSCLFRKRSMNLIHVDNVVAAILFLAQHPKRWSGDIFNVSEDDDQKNNFDYIERTILDELRMPYYFMPCIPIPSIFLKLFLNILGRNNIIPQCKFLPDKLINLGFDRPVNLDKGLRQYIRWHKSESR